MTAIVGIICKKGVVIGADSSATFNAGQINTMEQKTKKIHIHDNKIIVAGTGSIGLGQRFLYEVEKYFGHKANDPPVEICRKLSQAGMNNFASTQTHQGQYGALVAFPSQNKFHLCEFDSPRFQPELKSDHLWYVSMGSGQILCDPFLGFIRKIFWRDEKPDLKDGIFATIWTLQHAIELNTGGVNGPIQVAIMEYTQEPKIEARFLSEEEIAEHQNNINALEDHIFNFKNGQAGKKEDIAEVPKPDG